ncbi:hypothetical protein [Planctomicrobium sp. SH527]|uniref:hypothetical protein n=1 Tax=Planctomicrobium sp. SH527 TaxID=3448123 RepID=UPI003F5B8090
MSLLKNHRLQSLMGVLFAVVFVVGCGESGPKTFVVEGTVTIDGKPLPAGTVMFIPEGTGPYATGKVGKDGKYRAEVVEGRHQIAVSSVDYPEGPEGPVVQLAPSMYSSEQTSGLSAEVKAGNDNKVDLALVSPKKAGKR